MKTFKVPLIYRSPLISAVKNKRRQLDKMKRDFSPSLLDFGPVRIYLSRHFGFCYGVENAIDISFATIEQNPGKRIFLLSEMIHNPQVNDDLRSRGVRFLQDTQGRELIPFERLGPEDIVIIPAFGTTLEIEKKLKDLGIPTQQYNTTCPFVEKVWNRSIQIAKKDYTVVVHGKPGHEETRATFSHAAQDGPSVIISDMEEARRLAQYIGRLLPSDQFYSDFKNQYSDGFEPYRDLRRIGLVNQTTMLAGDTQAIADFLRKTMIETYRLTENSVEEYFADTRDTLCYATNDNQTAVIELLKTDADLAFVVGGYNSSNTSHLVELCEEKLPTFFINDPGRIISAKEILHYQLADRVELLTSHYLPERLPLSILVTSGASCPDATVESIILKLAGFFPGSVSPEEMIGRFS